MGLLDNSNFSRGSAPLDPYGRPMMGQPQGNLQALFQNAIARRMQQPPRNAMPIAQGMTPPSTGGMMPPLQDTAPGGAMPTNPGMMPPPSLPPGMGGPMAGMMGGINNMPKSFAGLGMGATAPQVSAPSSSVPPMTPPSVMPPQPMTGGAMGGMGGPMAGIGQIPGLREQLLKAFLSGQGANGLPY